MPICRRRRAISAYASLHFVAVSERIDAARFISPDRYDGMSIAFDASSLYLTRLIFMHLIETTPLTRRRFALVATKSRGSLGYTDIPPCILFHDYHHSQQSLMALHDEDRREADVGDASCRISSRDTTGRVVITRVNRYRHESPMAAILHFVELGDCHHAAEFHDYLRAELPPPPFYI